MTFSRFLALYSRHLVGPGLVLWSLAACVFLAPNPQSSLQTPRPATVDPTQTNLVTPAPLLSRSDHATPPVAGPTAMPGPLRPHQSVVLGSGIFARATYSDGQAPISDDEILERFTRTDVVLDPTGRGGCWISAYTIDKVWFRAGAAGAYWVHIGSQPAEMPEGAPTGILDRPTGLHGYLLDVRVAQGEWFCIVGERAGGVTFIAGPDLYYWYDSYCHRKLCD